MSALDDARETARWLRSIGEHVDADRVDALIAEHERLTAPPTDDEREVLAAILYEDFQSRRFPSSPFRWAAAHMERDEWLRRADAVLAAGFRRQGPITDAQVEAAARALWADDDYSNFDTSWDTAQHAYRVAARAALEAARAAS